MARAVITAFTFVFLAYSSVFAQTRGLTGEYEIRDAIDRGSTVQVTFVLKLANRTREQLSGARVAVLSNQLGAPAYIEFHGTSLQPRGTVTLKGFVDLSAADYLRMSRGMHPDIKVFDIAPSGESRRRTPELTRGIQGSGDTN